MTKKKKPLVFVGEEHLDKLKNDPRAYLDIETNGLNPHKDKTAVITFFSENENVVVVTQPRGKVSKRLQSYIGSREEIVGHNILAFDLLFLANAGVDVLKPKLYDTMVSEGCILTSERRDVSVSLKASVQRRVGTKLKKDQDHTGWMNEILTAQQIEYCSGDVRELANLRNAQIERADEGQKDAIQLESELAPAIVQMSLNGLPISRPKLETYIKGQAGMMAGLRGSLIDRLGPINLASPVQMKKALNQWLESHGDAPLTGTSAIVLQEQSQLGGQFGKLCEDILEYRHSEKRVKLYTPAWMDRFILNGRVRPRWWTTRTETLRMSSSDPNCQAIPRDMRAVFGGVPGHQVVKVDLQQVEVRMAASVANCPGLRAAFEAGRHIHTDIASRVFSIPYDEVATREGGRFKQLAKKLTFTLLFGGGVETFQLSAKRDGMHLTRSECEKIFSDFFQAYPGLLELKREASRQCKKSVVILRLPTGVKRILAGYTKTPSRVQNSLIQGGAAAGFKLGMLEAYKRGLFEYVCGAVHDEIVACVPTKAAKEFAVELEQSMNLGMEQIMDVPSVAVGTIGEWWS